ncbi:MAG: anaerobic magnesium-protoporphyrin IX monomethyl ester cyclase [Myxococcota bacterium]
MFHHCDLCGLTALPCLSMAKVHLIMPVLPQLMGAPYLGQQLVAASLVRAGHNVRVTDLASPYAPSEAELQDELHDWRPDIVGMTLFTWSAARGYALAQRLRNHPKHHGLLVAGGPHPTVRPGEPLHHGFDRSLAGEGELALVALADAIDAGNPPDRLQPAETIDDLDALAYPAVSYGLYDWSWYLPGGGAVIPGGIMSSRGCPARCTFCANYVTGRTYRFRSAESVVAEMVDLREHHGVNHFPFWDDAFTALRPRLYDLCDAMSAHPGLSGVTWSCITPGNMVKPRDLDKMRGAGCIAINFGLESGDYNILRVIQKGQRPEHVKAAVAAAKNAGMQTIVNFMFGFPEEGVPELLRTRELMEELSSSTDYFNHRGVLVPFPGTSIYDQHHKAFGLDEWWLDETRVPVEPNPMTMGEDERRLWLETDPTLEQDFFHYSDAIRDTISDCVRYKAQHNERTIAALMSSLQSGTPIGEH